MRPNILTIAGSDPSGGAGIQADIQTIAALGGRPFSAVTALTVQNTLGVNRVRPVSAEFLGEQVKMIFDDVPMNAVKIGMVGSNANAAVLTKVMRSRRLSHLVCDPVLASSGGHPLLDDDGIHTLVSGLFQWAEVVTPNAPEAELLTGTSVRSPEEAERAGKILLERGIHSVLVKGGHFVEGRGTDVLVTPERTTSFRATEWSPRVTHGTGCFLSSALATLLALGIPLEEAAARAKEYVTRVISESIVVGKGARLIDFNDLEERMECLP